MGTPRTKANNKWNAKAYDRYSLMLKRGQKDIYKNFAKQHGMSLNEFIIKAMSEKLDRMGGIDLTEFQVVNMKTGELSDWEPD